MSIELAPNNPNNLHEVYVGDLTLFFSYETLIGFAVPGVGRVTCENVWSNTTGRHINSIKARHSQIAHASFTKAQGHLDAFFSGKKTKARLIKDLEKVLHVNE